MNSPNTLLSEELVVDALWSVLIPGEAHCVLFLVDTCLSTVPLSTQVYKMPKGAGNLKDGCQFCNWE